MFRYINKIKSIVYIIIYKIKYKNKISILPKQRLGKCLSINISKNDESYIKIDNFFHTKRNVSIHSQGGKIIIGKNVFFNENCNIVSHKNIIINENSTFGPNVCIYDHDHNYLNGGFISGDIVIGKNVWVGANSVILRDTNIGDNCVIGAGSVVRGHYSANTKIVQDRGLNVKRICNSEERNNEFSKS